jgi:pyruvate/2-oxoglutarate/acetoin dehydrogenase E1 component
MNNLEQIRKALLEILTESPESVLLGEDISDPYGGAFKVTKTLSSQVPNKVIQTPISEAGFTGVATGMAYLGFKPIVEIMFGDFLTLITETIINTASKFPWFAQDKFKGSILIRSPIGGGRGYGPIHSQSLEKIFLGWPDVTIICPNILTNWNELFINTYNDNTPVKFFLENKLDYPRKTLNRNFLSDMGYAISVSESEFPIVTIYNDENPDVTIFCYGGMVNNVIKATYDLLIEEEVTSRMIIPTKIFPLQMNSLIGLMGTIEKVVFIEEGYAKAGWSSYLLSELANSEKCNINLSNILTIGPEFNHIPANFDAEKKHFPSSKKIFETLAKFL